MLKRKLRRLRLVLEDSRWWPFYIQRRFMNPVTRSKLTAWVAKTRPKSLQMTTTPAILLKHAQELNSAGISHLGAVLTASQTLELRTYFSGLKVFDDYRPETPPFLPHSDLRHPQSHVAHHNACDIIRAPYLLKLANDPLLIDIAGKFLGCKPTIGYLATWWSYRTTNGAQQAEHFHRDVDDLKFLKLFIYLTDVGENNGPHIYVTHSSSSNKLCEIRRFDDAEVVSQFGRENILQLTGNSGECFLEDTFGIHKGQPVQEGIRLIFQVVYSIFPLPYGPRTPVIKQSELTLNEINALDPWVNRLYVSCDE
ncbi:hypothetical protein BH11PSE12_BH11PSE12_00310 [soil metagenome]